MISPISACTSSSVITPASMALRSSPTLAHCAVMSVTTFRVAQHARRDLVLRRLVRPRGDDQRVRPEPLLLEDPLPARGLREHDVRVPHRVLRGGARVVREPGAPRTSSSRTPSSSSGSAERERLLEAVHRRGGARHGLRDDARADERHALRALRGEVLHRHRPRRARSQIRQVPVLVQHLRPARLRVAHHEHARARGQALLHVLVEAHVRQLHRPRRRALDVPALDVAVAGPRVRRLRDADVHRQRHVHLPAGELRERVLHRRHQRARPARHSP